MTHSLASLARLVSARLFTSATTAPGLYETASNLGTVLMLAGDLKGGLPHIDRALALNPDAHFGREKYQKFLAEYALAKRPDGRLTFPLQPVLEEGEYFDNADNFAVFLAGKLGQERLAAPAARAAVQGVLGMMRFADHTSPLLLEALGDLLHVAPDDSFDEAGSDAKRLAARAYLRAAGHAGGYRRLAGYALFMQTTHRRDIAGQLTVDEVEADFTRELADAAGWYARLEAQEKSWVESGADVDAEFTTLYAADPAVIELDTAGDNFARRMYLAGATVTVVVAAGVTLTVWLARRLIRRLIRRRATASAPL